MANSIIIVTIVTSTTVATTTGNVQLQFFNDDVSLLNTAYLTEPLIVHGNGPSKVSDIN